VQSNNSRAKLAAAMLTMSAHFTSGAQPVPIQGAAAQEYIREQERERAQRELLQPEPNVRLDRGVDRVAGPLLVEEDKPCFPIQHLETGHDLEPRFAQAVHEVRQALFGIELNGPAVCLGAKSINRVLESIQNRLVERGFVTTRVLAEPQDLKSGTLVVTVITGKVRNVRMDDGGSMRGQWWNALPARPGEVLDLRDIEQGLENFKRVPTAEADIQITPGDLPGESDIVIRWKQAFPFRLNLSVDDAGSKSTGKYQGSATISYDHAFTLNDLLYVTFNHDLGGGESGPRGTRGTTAHYSVPFGYWLVGLTSSQSNYYQSVAGATQTYVYSGDNQTSDLRLSRLIYRDAVRKTTVTARGWTRSSKNFVDDTEVEVQRRRVSGWEGSLSHREFIGQATLDATLAYRRGTGANDAMPSPEEAFGEGTSRMSLVTADAQASVPFTVSGQRLRYSGTWRTQWNRTPLAPQDRLSIGSRYTVRGFDGESSLSAERGWVLRNDVGIAAPSIGAEFYVALDAGRVGGRSAQFLIGQHLVGTAIGLRGGFKSLSYDLFVGTPVDKPERYESASTTGGFNLNWSF
jgi:hemolysin activation/secretion protein